MTNDNPERKERLPVLHIRMLSHADTGTHAHSHAPPCINTLSSLHVTEEKPSALFTPEYLQETMWVT